MPPRTTVWTLDDHTRGKHLVLQSYMDAWLPIILSQYDRALFVDAFAGPGEYQNGEPGSPTIAMRALTNHAHKGALTGRMDYIFIEKEENRYTHLRNVIEREKSNSPSICHVTSHNDTFEGVFPELIRLLESNRSPAFVMIDPFGVSGVSMEQIEALMEYPSTEVYFSFMYDWINRFDSEPGFADHLDKLFGCPDWRQAANSDDTSIRKNIFHDTYKRQLRRAGGKHILSFELFDGNRHVYTLFFTTQSDQGCDKMKQAMWKTAPFGDFRFRGGMNRQFTLGPGIVDFSPIQDDLREEFGLNQYVQIEYIMKFMRSDKTTFHTGQVRKVLIDMEKKGLVEIKEGTRTKRRTYPNGTILKFVDPPPPQPKQATMF